MDVVLSVEHVATADNADTAKLGHGLAYEGIAEAAMVSTPLVRAIVVWYISPVQRQQKLRQC